MKQLPSRLPDWSSLSSSGETRTGAGVQQGRSRDYWKPIWASSGVPEGRPWMELGIQADSSSEIEVATLPNSPPWQRKPLRTLPNATGRQSIISGNEGRLPSDRNESNKSLRSCNFSGSPLYCGPKNNPDLIEGLVGLQSHGKGSLHEPGTSLPVAAHLTPGHDTGIGELCPDGSPSGAIIQRDPPGDEFQSLGNAPPHPTGASPPGFSHYPSRGRHQPGLLYRQFVRLEGQLNGRRSISCSVINRSRCYKSSYTGKQPREPDVCARGSPPGGVWGIRAGPSRTMGRKCLRSHTHHTWHEFAMSVRRIPERVANSPNIHRTTSSLVKKGCDPPRSRAGPAPPGRIRQRRRGPPGSLRPHSSLSAGRRRGPLLVTQPETVRQDAARKPKSKSRKITPWL